MEQLNLKDDDIQQVLLAGSFGSYLSPASAIQIGLVPKIPVMRIVSAGNVAGEGAKMGHQQQSELPHDRRAAASGRIRGRQGEARAGADPLSIGRLRTASGHLARAAENLPRRVPQAVSGARGRRSGRRALRMERDRRARLGTGLG